MNSKKDTCGLRSKLCADTLASTGSQSRVRPEIRPLQSGTGSANRQTRTRPADVIETHSAFALAAGKYRYSVASEQPIRSATFLTVISGSFSKALATAISSSETERGRPPKLSRDEVIFEGFVSVDVPTVGYLDVDHYFPGFTFAT